MWFIRGFLLIPLAIAWLALSPTAQAVDPPPDGGYPGENTVEGDDALFSLTTGLQNTAIGFQALYSNTTGISNTATGDEALTDNTTGFENTATGYQALENNTIGFINTADGASALYNNTTGSKNTANGGQALFFNTTGNNNTATGFWALFGNTTGDNNTANGFFALANNTTGANNTASGVNALLNNVGSNNIGLGHGAGFNLTTGSNNIDIFNRGVADEANTIRIGTRGTQKNAYIAGISGVTVAGGVGVIIDTNGHLGTVVSSERFKDEIKSMDKASEAILALQPVTFRYKHELDPDGIPQFGLVAEQVEKVNPALVARDDQGKPYSVRYEAVNAMLLNEFLKEHRKVDEQQATITQVNATVAKQAAIIAQQKKDFQASITKLEATVAQQQKDFQSTATQQQAGIKALTASLKEQASQIQKVTRLRRVEVTKRAPQMVLNNQ
jgi:hypothetical protein